MKKKNALIYITLVVMICILPFAAMSVCKTTVTSENKKLAELPSIKTDDGGINLEYMSSLGDYFSERFAFRQKLVSANSWLSAKIYKTSTVADVILGQDDWLYYSATLDDYRHDNPVSERELYNMAHNMKLMQEYVEGTGAKFVFTIAPNKNSLYGEWMPESYKHIINDKSDAQRLKPYLEAENVKYVDLFELFNEQEEILYYKKDSHWNHKGAVLVYNELLDAVNYEHYTYEDIEPQVVDNYYGDLDKMLYADFAKPESDYKYMDYFPYAYLDPAATVEDQTIETISPGQTGNVLMYRDSFGNTLLPYFASAFKNGYFSKVVPYPITDLDEYQPDVVVVEKVERHLPTLASVPPIMPATEAKQSAYESLDLADAAWSGENMAEYTVSDSNGYVKIEGLVNETAIDCDSPIAVRVNKGSDSIIYDAFCTSSKSGDYGFEAYLTLGESDVYSIDIIGVKDGLSVVLKEGN